MPSTASEYKLEKPVHSGSSNIALLVGVAAAFAIAHIATNGRYGFHRDELQFLSDARHLDWGFVPYPPMTPFLEHIGLSLFGPSLVGLRMFSVIAQAILIVISGLMARDLNGGRLAQVTTTLAVALSPLPIFEATEFQYTSFAMLWYVLITWFTIRLLKTENPRWWLAIGAAVGVGLLTKYSITFFIAGILIGLVLTRARKYFASPWFWGGIAIALVIFLPNLVWLARHDFISYTFLQHIHKRDVGEGRAAGFLTGQFWLCANLAAAPVWIAGLFAFLLTRRYRLLGLMYLVPLILFWVGKGRFYYMAEAYPMLLAMGAVSAELWLSRLKTWTRRSIEAVFFAGLFVTGAYVCAILVPLAPSGPLRDFALSKNGDLREEIGWDELVNAVAGVRDSLPPAQQTTFGILVGNYGEQGALELLGPARNLPSPISLTNSAWLRSYPQQPPSTLIVIGYSKERADRDFTACSLAGHIGNSLGVKNEESKDHPDIFVCGPPREPWPQFWKDHQWFG